MIASMRPMRIAQIAPLFESVPPLGYGGTERIVSYLTEELVRMGHEVTLFATGDSRTSARLAAVAPKALRLHHLNESWPVWNAMLLDEVMQQSSRFDVMHFHTDVMHLPLSTRCGTPSLSTLHGRLDLIGLPSLYARFRTHPLVSISDAQRKPLPQASWLATVPHGLPMAQYDYVDRADDYFIFLGRISPQKRLDRAIDVAVRAGKRLVVCAKVDEGEKDYFDDAIKPLLDHPLVDFVGEIDDARKQHLLGRARALLFLIDWPEPFGLVLLEAMACGTPVIAYAEGAVPEIVEDGVTGRIVAGQEEAVRAAQEIDHIDRRRCREVFMRRFTATAMAENYLRLYRSLV